MARCSTKDDPGKEHRYNSPAQAHHRKWGGRYVSQADVEVAAELHPAIKGMYPRYNISTHMVLPDDARLSLIKQARTQDYKIRDPAQTYTFREGGERISGRQPKIAP